MTARGLNVIPNPRHTNRRGQASAITALAGVLAFWACVLMAAHRYPSEYDWRYMPLSNLFAAPRNPAGHLWAAAGIVASSLCGLAWSALLPPAQRPAGIKAFQFGIIFMAGSAALPESVLPLRKGHELLTVLAFAGLCLGLIVMMFRTIERRLSRHARWASLLAGSAVLPILLAGLAQAYVFYALPAMPWVNLTWRTRGVPVWLSFAFWEWITCATLSAHMAILALIANKNYGVPAEPTHPLCSTSPPADPAGPCRSNDNRIK